MNKKQLLEQLETLPEDWQGFLVPLSRGQEDYLDRLKVYAYITHFNVEKSQQVACDLLGISTRTVRSWNLNKTLAIVQQATN